MMIYSYLVLHLLPLLFPAHASDGVVIDARVYTYAIALAQATKVRPMEPYMK